MTKRNWVKYTIITGLAFSAGHAASTDWSERRTEWNLRREITVPDGTTGWVRVPFPAEAHPARIRVVDSQVGLLPTWIQGIERTSRHPISVDPKAHLGFPRMVRLSSGELLIFYRRGTTHAWDDGWIVMKRSRDSGKSWSAEQVIRREPPSITAHNPVPFVLPNGRVLLWVSRAEHQKTPSIRMPVLWSESSDDGNTWSPFTLFDASPDRSCYYVTDVIGTSDGFLAAANVFPASGVGNCHNLIFHSTDGRRWTVRATLTPPTLDEGNEIALLSVGPEKILCLRRARGTQRATFRQWSNDNGRTWTQPENLVAQLGVFQRPNLTRVNASTILLHGRDSERRQVVVYVSRDNGVTLGERQVLDSYVGDGAYTTAEEIAPDTFTLAWYGDSHGTINMPDIVGTNLTVASRPRWLWVNVGTEPFSMRRMYVYQRANNPPQIDGFAGILPTNRFAEGKLGEIERRPERVSPAGNSL